MVSERDHLQLYRGKDYKITDDIIVHTPTIGEICDYGEQAYFTMVSNLCATGSDLCWQLEKAKIKWDEIPDYDLFRLILSNFYSTEQTSILFGNELNLKEMKEAYDSIEDKIVLLQTVNRDGVDHDIVIDTDIYDKIVTHLRNVHGLKKNSDKPGNEVARQAMIEDAEEEYMIAKSKPYKSSMLQMVSAMVNSEGFKRNDKDVWNMNIYAFMDSVKRISKIRDVTLLLQSGYSGFGIDLSKIKNKDKMLNYMGELD